MTFREHLLEEKAKEIKYQIDKISKKRKEFRHKKALEYCKEVCKKYKNNEAQKILSVIGEI